MDKSALHENPPEAISYDGDSAVDKVVRPEAELSEVFAGLTRLLRRHYPINKGVLVLREEDGASLSAISTWHEGNVRDGLRLSLPANTSLFEKVAESGHAYTEDFCASFSGNFFERKLLLDDDSQCFAIQPLKSDGRVLGLLGYSSRRPDAFAMLNEGALDDIADKFGEVIENTLSRR
ncbi:MAG: GAF domain-containing protein [bacterium]